MFLAGGSFAVNTATFYILITGVLDYTTRDLGMKRDAVLTVSLCVSLTQLVLIPAAAALSDRVGRIRIYAFGAVGIALWAVPMFLLIDTGSLLWLAVGTFVAGCFLSIMYGPRPPCSPNCSRPRCATREPPSATRSRPCSAVASRPS